MSYENTSCPCGWKKPTNTMLCDECVEAFKDRPELKAYQDHTADTGYRRHCAIILVSNARKRRRAKDRQLSWV